MDYKIMHRLWNGIQIKLNVSAVYFVLNVSKYEHNSPCGSLRFAYKHAWPENLLWIVNRIFQSSNIWRLMAQWYIYLFMKQMHNLSALLYILKFPDYTRQVCI